MTFLQPLALFGLAAAAIPVLLHLFQRRTPPELDFPPVRWLADAERRSAQALRLRHLVLLALRTALIVAVVLAAARPVAPVRAAGGAHPPTALAVVLDNSPSAGAVGGGRAALDRLRIAAHTTLAQASAGDRLFLILADGVLRAGSRAELLAAVDSVRPAAVRLDLPAAVTRAARAVDGEPLAVREVEVLSDLQRTALADGLANVPAGVAVRVLAAAASPPNRGIGAAAARDGAMAVTVTGTPGAEPAPLTLSLAGREVARALAAPGDLVVLPLPSLAPGWWAGEVRLTPDELRADDARPVAVHVAPPAAVTLGPDAGSFVAAALAVLREARRATMGGGVRVGGRPLAPAIVQPPQDPALLGAANRDLAAVGLGWRFGAAGTPGPIVTDLPGLAGVPVARRQRLDGSGGDVLARVNGEPWLVRRDGVVLLGSRLDTAWTALPTSPAFVPFVDQLVNRVVRGEAAVATVEGPAGLSFTVGEGGHDTLGATIAAPDPRESDLTPAAAAETRRALGAAPLADAAFAAARFGAARRADLSALLLVLALLCAGAETVVAARAR